MACKTNVVINGIPYYQIKKRVGNKLNKDGKWVPYYKTFQGKSKKEAEAKYMEYMQKREYGADKQQSIAQLMDVWIDEVFMHSNLADSTKNSYLTAYYNYFQESDTARIPLAEIRPMQLQTFLNNVNCTPGPKKSLKRLLSKFFKYADVNGICPNYMISVEVKETSAKRKEADDEIEIWSDDELDTLLNNIGNHRLRFLVILAINTGARISELLALKYTDIKDKVLNITKQTTNVNVKNHKSDEAIRIVNPKSQNSIRQIPLNDMVIEELKRHKAWHLKEMEDCGYYSQVIFTTRTGNYVDRKSAAHSLSRLYKRIGLPDHTFHSFRHTFGTNLSRAGVPIEITYVLMGHSSIDVTAQYYINVQSDRKIDALKKLNDLYSKN